MPHISTTLANVGSDGLDCSQGATENSDGRVMSRERPSKGSTEPGAGAYDDCQARHAGAVSGETLHRPRLGLLARGSTFRDEELRNFFSALRGTSEAATSTQCAFAARHSACVVPVVPARTVMLGATLARILVLVALAATALARDFYQVLGLDRSCSDKDLKRACTSTCSSDASLRRLLTAVRAHRPSTYPAGLTCRSPRPSKTATDIDLLPLSFGSLGSLIHAAYRL